MPALESLLVQGWAHEKARALDPRSVTTSGSKMGQALVKESGEAMVVPSGMEILMAAPMAPVSAETLEVDFD